MGVVIVNPRSGPGETTAGDLRPLFDGHDIEETDGSDLTDLVRAAVASGTDFVGVAGGDGSIRCAAGLLAGAGTALLPVPTGTRNHFARAVGIVTVGDAEAAAEGRRIRVDLGEVNGEVFVNNSSIGFYAALVRRREVHEKRMPKVVAQLVAAWKQVRHGHRFQVSIDGEHHRAWIVFVGNGCYGDNLADLGDRDSFDAGVLDIRVLRADRRLARARIAVSLLLGRAGRSPLLIRQTTPEVEIVVEGTLVDVALDGEVVRLESPLRYRVRAQALTVLTPPAS